MSASDIDFARPHSILFATDLGSRCDRALDRAVQLARAWKSRLVVLTVLDPGVASAKRAEHSDQPSWRLPLDPRVLAERALRADAAAGDVRIEFMVKEGHVGQMIRDAAVTRDCGLIVTGQGRSAGLLNPSSGSNVDWLVRHCGIPLLVVRRRVHAPYRSAVAASDFSDSALHALKVARVLFSEVEFALLHAFGTPHAGMLGIDRALLRQRAHDHAVGESEQFLVRSGVPADVRSRMPVLIEYGEPDEVLDTYVRDHDIDLAVIGSHGRTALFDVLIGSVASRILKTAGCDVLCVREPRARG